MVKQTDMNKQPNMNKQTNMNKIDLPKNIHLMSLQPQPNGNIFLRLKHIFPLKEDPTKYSHVIQTNKH